MKGLKKIVKNIGLKLPEGYLDFSKVIGGMLSHNFLRGVTKLIVAGLLTPQAFGALRAVYSFFKISASVVGFGLDYAITTFAPSEIENNNQYEKSKLLKTTIFIKTVAVFLFGAMGLFFTDKIALDLLGDPKLEFYVKLVFFALLGQTLWKYCRSHLSAHQHFSKVGIFLATAPVIMLSVMLVLVATNRFNLTTIIVIYLFAPTLTTLIWWPIIIRDFAKSPIIDNILVKKIVRFSRWIYVSNLSATIRGHANPILLKNPTLSGSIATGELNAGLYSFGNDLAGEITIISQSLTTVLLPKASSKANVTELKRFVKKAYKGLSLLILPLILPFFFIKYVILLLGMIKPSYLDYLPALDVFRILYAAGLFSIISIPMKAVCYALHLPKVEANVEMMFVIIMIVGGIILIPTYGIKGAAIMVFIQRFVSFLVVTSYGAIKLNQSESCNNA